MAKKHRVLLVEDEEVTRSLLTAYLEKEGLDVTVANDGAEMFACLDHKAFEVLLLDLSLPGEDGLTLLRQIRSASNLPVIVVTARNQRPDRLAALEMGADDYLHKPFDPQELVLRARNVISRTASRSQDAAGVPVNDRLEFNGWALNLGARTLTAPSGEDVAVTRSEFDILSALVRSPDRVLSRAQLLDTTAHFGNEPSDRTIDVLISRLRKKIAKADAGADFIVTVPGFGYKLRRRS